MTATATIETSYGKALSCAANQAVRAIPPAWPLSATVAVNPFVGQSDESLDQTAARLTRIGGVRLALPRSYYADKIARGEITDEDLISALQSSIHLKNIDLQTLKLAVNGEPRAITALPTVVDLAARFSGTDWSGLVAERIGAFAAGYFDEGQALWAASRRNGVYAAWRAFATHDLTPEIHGLSGFGTYVADTPETPHAAVERAALSLGLVAEPGTYFHQLLLTIGGWAQFARHIQFKAELDDRTDSTAFEMLAIRLVFEQALYIRYKHAIGAEWHQVRRSHTEPLKIDHDMIVDGLLQVAAERAAQSKLAKTLATPSTVMITELRPMLQAAFCIDVRSEVFRRALESTDPGIRTLGFAGFFGLAISHKDFASDVSESRLPVLLKPSVFTCSAVDIDEHADRKARFSARGLRAWGRFKLAAVSSFAFVEAMGPVYAGKLLRDGLGFDKGHKPEMAAPRFSPSLDLETRAEIAESVLRAMSLTQGFARFVLLIGHRASVDNNPYASALNCGACGGYPGDVNARLLANLLNDRAVRGTLAGKGMNIPAETVFLGGLHDTTTDRITLFEDDLQVEVDAADFKKIREWLAQAGELTRTERARRLPRATAQSISERSRDWAEIRPELGLAGCRTFIVAPRSRTAGRSLEGQAFLHDYVWQQDEGFRILELILTAPVIVASWINLQYFGSVVAPSIFGSGNKLLHNVVGGIGVLEGNGGNLRAGLAWQSVHDGSEFIHEPLRLTVAIEAPKEAIADILLRHPQVRTLFDNCWLSLFTLDEKGHMEWRYAGVRGWLHEDFLTVRCQTTPVSI
ncbi:MAG: YbcC family protein [Allorhizobium sp.]